MGKLTSRILIGLGLFGLGYVSASYLDSYVGSRSAVSSFKEQAAVEQRKSSLPEFQLAEFDPDQSLWSDDAREKFDRTKNVEGTPVALLKIDRLKLEAPVFMGTNRTTLNRGVGVVDNTAAPGEPGNVALSAHRDSFFRPLKDIVIGDTIELQTLQGIQQFQVSDITIVDPTDISVLEPTERSILTLITCYPFYFVGYAPDRYIVRAELIERV
jgi:sortase A